MSKIKIPVEVVEEVLNQSARPISFSLRNDSIAFDWNKTSGTEDYTDMEWEILSWDDIEFDVSEIDFPEFDKLVQENDGLRELIGRLEHQLEAEHQVVKRLTELQNKKSWWRIW